MDNLQKRTEEIRVDTNSINIDVKMLRMKMSSLETNIGVIKIDIEKLKENVEDLILQNAEIVSKMVTQEEHQDLEQRVKLLTS